MYASSKTLYWLLALGCIDRQEVVAWADVQLANGSEQVDAEGLHALSTCSALDVNDVMRLLRDVDIQGMRTASELLQFLSQHYTQCADSELFKTRLLVEFCRIDDFGPRCANALCELEDTLVRVADGVYPEALKVRPYILGIIGDLQRDVLRKAL
jgi:hypothetical protein